MKRHLSQVLSILSITLFVAVTFLWLRSYWAMDSWTYCSGRPTVLRQEGSRRASYPRIWSIRSSWGRLAAGYRVDNSRTRSFWHSGAPSMSYDPFLVRPATSLRLLGFEYVVDIGAPLTSSYAGIDGQGDIVIVRYWAMPYWFLSAVTGAIAWWLWRRNRRRRLAEQRGFAVLTLEDEHPHRPSAGQSQPHSSATSGFSRENNGSAR